MNTEEGKKKMNDKWNPYDAYPDLGKVSNWVYKNTNPPLKSTFISDRNDAQEKLTKFLKPKKKITYPQDWRAYNKAKCGEPIYFPSVLGELLAFVKDNEKPKIGRPPYSKKDKIFSMCAQMYDNKGSRKAMSCLVKAKEKGYLNRIPPITGFNSLLNFYSDESLTPLLRQLITLSAYPLREVENHVAVDSTGFSTRLFEPWMNHRKGSYEKKRLWKKAHIVSGVKTNIILNVTVTQGYSHDAPQFERLIMEISKYFGITKISADMAYSSRDITGICQELNITPYIPFPKNTRGNPKGVQLYRTMYDYERNNPEEFKKEYHKRSNIESTNFMIKNNFSHKLRTFKESSQVNEILVKCLCHNICCIIQESFELGIDADFSFCADSLFAQK